MTQVDLLAPARLLYPDFKLRLIRAIRHFEEGKDFRMKVTMGIRSFKKQQELYAQGRTTPGKIITNTKVSKHNFGVAADVATTLAADPYMEKDHRGEEKWERWGECVEAEGLVWGGRWARLVDMPHAEICYGVTNDDMVHLYEDGGISAVWEAFDRRRGADDKRLWSPILQELRVAGFEV